MYSANMNYITEEALRKKLLQALKGKTQSELAREMGVQQNFLCMAVNGSPITGKILEYLGYRKSRLKFYETVMFEEKK